MQKTIISKGRHVLGKLSRYGDKSAPRNCEAALTWELRTDGEREEFSACGEVWNHLRTDIVHGGQCVDDLVRLFPRDKIAARIRDTWRAWHLNGMNSGTSEQERAVQAAEADAIERLRNDPNAPAQCFYDEARTSLNWYIAWRYLCPGDNCGGFYTFACEALRKVDLYDVPITPDMRALGGFEPGATMYRYGTRHLYREIPADVRALILAGFKVEGEPTPKPRPAEVDPIAAAGLSIRAEFVPRSTSRNAKEKRLTLNWRVTLLHRERAVFTCDYSAGEAHTPAYTNEKLKRTMGSALHRDAIQEECEKGRAVTRLFSWGGWKYGEPIIPETRDVIHSLLLDCDAGEMSFRDWCANYGLDEDSRKARAAYDECAERAAALRGAIGSRAMAELMDGNA